MQGQCRVAPVARSSFRLGVAGEPRLAYWALRRAQVAGRFIGENRDVTVAGRATPAGRHSNAESVWYLQLMQIHSHLILAILNRPSHRDLNLLRIVALW